MARSSRKLASTSVRNMRNCCLLVGICDVEDQTRRFGAGDTVQRYLQHYLILPHSVQLAAPLRLQWCLQNCLAHLLRRNCRSRTAARIATFALPPTRIFGRAGVTYLFRALTSCGPFHDDRPPAAGHPVSNSLMDCSYMRANSSRSSRVQRLGVVRQALLVRFLDPNELVEIRTSRAKLSIATGELKEEASLPRILGALA